MIVQLFMYNVYSLIFINNMRSDVKVDRFNFYITESFIMRNTRVSFSKYGLNLYKKECYFEYIHQ